MRTCPHCQASISQYVIKCVHCDTWLVENPPETEWRLTEEEAARRAAVVEARQAARQPVAEDMPSVPGGGGTLDPVIILPDAEPSAN